MGGTFFPGTTQMHELVRNHDWTQTPLGPVVDWPHSLRSQVNVILNSRFAMSLTWGRELTQIYNDAYATMLASRHPNALGKSIRTNLPEVWEHLEPLFNQVLTTGEATWLVDALLPSQRHGYLEETYVTASHAPAFNENGDIVGVQATMIEVTEQVLTHRRLATTRDFSQMIELAQDNGQLRDLITKILGEQTMDVATFAMFGRSVAGDMRELNPFDLPGAEFWPLDRAISGESVVLHDLQHLGKTGGPWNNPVADYIVIPLTRINMDPAAFVIGLSPNRALDDEYRRFLSSISSQIGAAIGNARVYETQQDNMRTMKELDRVKTSFFSNMSHEMRTPMNAIVGSAQLLAGTELNDDQGEFVEMIRTASSHLLNIVNNVLDYSKIDAGHMEYATKPFDVTRCIQEAVDFVSVAASDVGLDLRVNLAGDLPAYAVGDANRIRQVLLNLLSNAIKFTPTGFVALDVDWLDDDVVRFTVSDSGIGIPPDRLISIFNVFGAVDNSLAGGTGLGLSITAAFVAGMGGTIRVNSELGLGSSFVIDLPIPETNDVPKTAQGTEVDTELAAKYPLRILIAEDHPVNQRVLVALLHRLGYQADVVATGEEALERVVRVQYDLILMDVQMPGMGGIAAAKEITKQLPSNHRPRIVAVTANALHEQRDHAFEAGMDGYITKPVTMSGLVGALTGQPDSAIVHLSGENAVEFPVLDRDRLDLVSASDPELITKLINTYMVATAELLDRLRTAVIKNDIKDASFVLHRLIGSSSAIGAFAMAALTRELEHAPLTTDTITRVQQEFGRLETELLQARP